MSKITVANSTPPNGPSTGKTAIYAGLDKRIHKLDDVGNDKILLENGDAPTAHGSSHISTGSDPIPDATPSQDGLESAADKSKLNGIQPGATANQTDAYLLSRTNHTGTQAASTISDFSTAADARVAAAAGVSIASLVGGLIPTTQIPPAALERLVVVADQAARYALTTATVQNGDTVKQNDTGVMYFVVDDTNLNNASGYQVYSAGAATTAVSFTGNLSGDVTGTQAATAISAATVTGKALTGFVSGAGTVSPSDTLLSAINKLDGNVAGKQAASPRYDYQNGTGIINGGTLSINTIDHTRVDVAAGTSLYVDNSNPTAPVVEILSWPAQTLLPPTLDSVSPQWLGISRSAPNTGAVIFSQTFTAVQKRTAALLGRIWSNGATTDIAGFANYQTPAWGSEKTLEDLMAALGPLNISGNSFSPNGSNLLLNKTAGSAFRFSGASGTSMNSPNMLIDTATTPVTAYRYLVGQGTSGATPASSTIEPNSYDNAGTLTAVPGSDFTVQRLFYYPGSKVLVVAYGQTLYASLGDALAGYQQEAFNLSTNSAASLEGSMLRGWVIVQTGATSLSNPVQAQVITAVGFGSGIGGGSGGTGVVAVNGKTGNVSLTTDDIPAGAANKYVTSTDLTHLSNLSGINSGDVTIGAFGSTPNANGLSLTGQALNLQPADATHSGGLSYTDWNTFNNKQAAGSYVLQSTTVNGHALSSNVSVTASDVGLGSVLNIAQAPQSSKYIVQGTTDTGLTGAQFLGALGTGIVKNTTTTGVLSIAIAADFPTLNQNTTGSAGSVAWSGVTGTPVSFPSFPHYEFKAPDLMSPNNADWPINANAPVSADPVNNALLVRRANDTTEQGYGFQVFIPTGATNIIFSKIIRAITAPGGTRTIIKRIRFRQETDGAAIPAWSAPYTMSSVTVPANAYFFTATQSIPLATLGLTAGKYTQFEMSRYATGNTLTGDTALLVQMVDFS